MHLRTLYNITRTRVFAGADKALAALAVLLCLSCSSSDVIEDIREIDLNGIHPLNFTCLTQDAEQEHSTRASIAQPLTSGFVVSTYKAYASANQQTVMNRYSVEYKTSGTAWDGNTRPYWDYTCVDGQYEKFWDLSAFPYRFHAVAPYPSNESHVAFDDKQLTINAPYSMQSSLNGMVTPANAEPYIVAQLHRSNDGIDRDILADKTILSANTTLNRYVSLPFHHLNSKVRFGIYSTMPWTTANPLYIEDMTIKVISDNFVTGASGYHSDGDTEKANSWYIGTNNSGFTNLTKVTEPTTHTQLLRFDGGKNVDDNDLSHHQGRSSAYWLQCPDGIMQIPQNDVILSVSLKLVQMDGTLYKEFTDVPIRMEDGTFKYNWLSGYIHTYYLIIGDIEDDLEITFTATLTPWEDVSGSLSTDLEQ